MYRGADQALKLPWGPFGINSHLTGREIEAQKGNLTCLRAHSYKWEQTLEVGCPDSTTSDAPCTVHAVRGPLVGADYLAFGELEEGLAFPLQPPSTAPYLGLSNSVSPQVSCSQLHL